MGRLDPDTPPVTCKRLHAQVVNPFSFYLDILSFTVPIIVRVLQCQSLKIDSDLTNVVIDGGYQEAADRGQGASSGVDEVCPVLARGGVAGLCEAAADSESLGTVSVSISAFRRTLIGGKAGA